MRMKDILRACIWCVFLTLFAACKLGMSAGLREERPESPFLAYMCGTVQCRDWREIEGVHFVQAHRIAQYAKERFYLPSGLWNQDLKHAEDTQRLQVRVLMSERHTVVVWYCRQETELDGRIFLTVYCHGICYVSESGEVISIGSKTVPLGFAFNSGRLKRWIFERARLDRETE